MFETRDERCNIKLNPEKSWQKKQSTKRDLFSTKLHLQLRKK